MKIGAAYFRTPRLTHTVPRIKKPIKRTAGKSFYYKPVLLILLLISLFLGAVLYYLFQDTMEPQIKAFYQTYCNTSGGSFWKRFGAALLPSFGTGALICYLGLSPFGRIAAVPVLTLRCMATGSVSTFLVQSFGKPGIAAFFAGFFPGRSLEVCALFLLCIKANRCSAYLKSCLKRDSSLDERWLISYLCACLPGLTLLLLAAAADALLQGFITVQL